MKKTIPKYLISLFSVFLVVLISMLPVFAATYISDIDWKYEVTASQSEYYIEAYLGSSSQADIPESYQQKPVTKINREAFLNNTTITSVSIPESVNSIGMNAFYGCTALMSLTVPDTVASIGNNAFYGCTSLETVTVEENAAVITIPRNCFSGCTSLTKVILSNNIERIEALSFNGCTELTSVTIPASVTYIAENAFSGCSNLVISGWEDTYAEQYAEQNGISFLPMDENTEPTTVPETTEAEVTEITLPDSSESETTQSTTSQKTAYLIGDSDLDYRITVKDATLIQKYSADLVNLDHNRLFLANCDGVEGVNVKDATQIQKYCAGFLNILFVGTEVEI